MPFAFRNCPLLQIFCVGNPIFFACKERVGGGKGSLLRVIGTLMWRRGVAYRSWFDPPIGRFSRRLWRSPAFTLRATNRIKPAPSLNMWLANCTVVVEHYLVLRFYGSVFRCHVSVWRRHYLSNALSCCACWQVFKLKLELWSDQPIIANINFPPLFVVFISGIFREQYKL